MWGIEQTRDVRIDVDSVEMNFLLFQRKEGNKKE